VTSRQASGVQASSFWGKREASGVISVTAYTNTPSTKKNMKINLTDLHNIFLSGFSMLNYV